MPGPGDDGIGAERAHAPTIGEEADCIVMITPHPILGVLGNPAQALSGVWAIIDHVAAECDGVPGSLSLEYSLQGRPVAMDVGEDQELHRPDILGKADLPG